ncbi:hypothetical protein ACIQOW_08440 [Kitasatospora sp. NPDC091335]|uniref:hypothetical protein n=1 Tax=Kitasatospora sp. NPDC091335 TaxID=3364085 RepID=UPI0037F1A522
MRVRMLVQMSGTRDGQDWPPPGTVLDLPEAEALQLAAHRNAVVVVEEQDDPEDEQDNPEDTDPEDDPDDAEPEDEAAEDGTGARRRGRPRLPRDAQGNIVRT